MAVHRVPEHFKAIWSHWPFLLLWIGLTVFQVWGIEKIPFHPDEATYLFMSGDLETLFTQPGQLGYDPSKQDDQPQKYRTIDGPLARYILGLGRWAFDLPPLTVDWDWGKTWEGNEAAGALPSPELLFAGRLAMTLLMPFSLLLAYRIGLALGGQRSALLIVAALGLNALILLHTRRAMAEGVLVFGALFAFWSFLKTEKYPWLAGLGIALAFNAKQSALALLPVGMLAVVWVVPHLNIGFETKNIWGSWGNVSRLGWRRWVVNLLLFFATFGFVTFALNPIYWTNPVAAVQEAVSERQDLLSRQVADAEKYAPGQVLETPGKRLAVILGQLYVLPLQFYEVGNYQAQTMAAEQAYLAIPGHKFLRGLAGGGILLALTLAGMVRGLLDIRRQGVARSRALILLFVATGVMGAALLVAVPLPFQRYSMPLLPFVVLWMGVGLKGK